MGPNGVDIRTLPPDSVPNLFDPRFWSEEWQASEHEYDANRAAGKLTGPMTGEQFIAWLTESTDAAADV